MTLLCREFDSGSQAIVAAKRVYWDGCVSVRVMEFQNFKPIAFEISNSRMFAPINWPFSCTINYHVFLHMVVELVEECSGDSQFVFVHSLILLTFQKFRKTVQNVL